MLIGEPEQNPDRLVGRPVLGVVEVEADRLGVHPLAAGGIGSEEVAQVRVPYRGRVILERRPGRGLPQRLHVGGILVRRGLGRHPLVLRPMSAMRDTMATQPALLRELLADGAPVEAAAERIRGRRVLLSGTGTSWHAANQGAWLLRAAGVEAWPIQAARRAPPRPAAGSGDALLLLSATAAPSAHATVARAGPGRWRGVRRHLGPRRAGVDIETSRARELLGLHREPSRRADAAGAARARAGRRARRFRRGP